MNRDDLLLLAEYDRWATDRLLAAAARLPNGLWTRTLAADLPCLRDALVRLVNSAVVWLARWQGRPLTIGLRAAAFADAAALQLRWEEAGAAVLRFVGQIPDAQLHAPFVYRTATGRQRQEVLGLTVLHRMTQAAYYRGRIITLIRLAGGATVHTDLLQFLRWRAASGGGP